MLGKVIQTFCLRLSAYFFFFNDTATTEIYTLSLHDALPICHDLPASSLSQRFPHHIARFDFSSTLSLCAGRNQSGSEEHTSELQSRLHLVCRLLLEKKKNAGRGTLLHGV